MKVLKVVIFTVAVMAVLPAVLGITGLFRTYPVHESVKEPEDVLPGGLSKVLILKDAGTFFELMGDRISPVPGKREDFFEGMGKFEGGGLPLSPAKMSNWPMARFYGRIVEDSAIGFRNDDFLLIVRVEDGGTTAFNLLRLLAWIKNDVAAGRIGKQPCLIYTPGADGRPGLLLTFFGDFLTVCNDEEMLRQASEAARGISTGNFTNNAGPEIYDILKSGAAPVKLLSPVRERANFIPGYALTARSEGGRMEIHIRNISKSRPPSREGAETIIGMPSGGDGFYAASVNAGCMMRDLIPSPNRRKELLKMLGRRLCTQGASPGMALFPDIPLALEIGDFNGVADKVSLYSGAAFEKELERFGADLCGTQWKAVTADGLSMAGGKQVVPVPPALREQRDNIHGLLYLSGEETFSSFTEQAALHILGEDGSRMLSRFEPPETFSCRVEYFDGRYGMDMVLDWQGKNLGIQ